jgi:hypothetical protein
LSNDWRVELQSLPWEPLEPVPAEWGFVMLCAFAHNNRGQAENPNDRERKDHNPFRQIEYRPTFHSRRSTPLIRSITCSCRHAVPSSAVWLSMACMKQPPRVMARANNGPPSILTGQMNAPAMISEVQRKSVSKTQGNGFRHGEHIEGDAITISS